MLKTAYSLYAEDLPNVPLPVEKSLTAPRKQIKIPLSHKKQTWMRSIKDVEPSESSRAVRGGGGTFPTGLGVPSAKLPIEKEIGKCVAGGGRHRYRSLKCMRCFFA